MGIDDGENRQPDPWLVRTRCEPHERIQVSGERVNSHAWLLVLRDVPRCLLCESLTILTSVPLFHHSYDPNNLKFEFDNLHTARPFNPQEGDVAHVFLVTNGPLPTYPTSR